MPKFMTLSWRHLLLSVAGPIAALAVEPADNAVARSTLLAVGEMWHLADGGLARGGAWNTFVDARIGIDGRAWGGSIRSTLVGHVHWVKNQNQAAPFGDKTGAFNPVSGFMAADHVRVFKLYYQRSAQDEAWTFKAGQIAIDDDFMASDFSGLFANSAFGAMPSQTATLLASDTRYGTAYGAFPVAVPGVWVETKLSESVSLQAGLYHGGPGPDEDNNVGFTWEKLGTSGVVLFSELAWRHRWMGGSWTSRFGVSGHTGRFDDLAAQRNGEVSRVHGLHSVYTVQDVVLAADAEGAPTLGLFFRLGASPQCDRSAVTRYSDAGFNWYHPLPGRKDDVCGAAVSVTHFGPDYRVLNSLAREETTLEFTYSARVTAAFTAQADVQCLLAPARHPVSGRRENAWVVGVRAMLAY